MIVPSIDIMGGQAVQLIGGEVKALEAGDPIRLAEKFRLVGEIAVIDLDAALGQGSNRSIIRKMVRMASCRVGGGIRDFKTAVEWLDAGASKIILGTRAEPELLRKLPRERLVAALDARHGEVVIEGWKTRTGVSITERIGQLKSLVGGFLITFVEREGRMQGTDMKRISEIVTLTGDTRITFAGGITTTDEIRRLDELGADAQVGMALYKGSLDLAEGFAAPLRSDRRDGLFPTIVCDEHGVALGLTYSDLESLREALATSSGVYRSRKRGLWIKGRESGATQELIGIDLDCDRDCLRFRVRQKQPGFCHLGLHTCFGSDEGIASLVRKLGSRKENAPKESYTRKLFTDRKLLNAKLCEEADELVRAKRKSDVVQEAADLIFFSLVKLVKAGATLEEVEKELFYRSLKMTRRPGAAKKGKRK